MTILELLLEFMMIMDIPDWGVMSLMHFGWSAYALSKLSLKFGWNLLSLKASRSPSKIDDIVAGVAGVYDDYGHSWLGLVSLMTFWMVCICPEEAMFKIWLKSVKFEGIKITLKDWWHCCICWWSLGWLWTFLNFAGALYIWQCGLPRYALRKLCLKLGWNLLSLKASRTLSKIDDISGVFDGIDDDCGCSWLGLMSLMTFWMVCLCSEEAMLKIWLNSYEFEGIKIPLKDGWHFWSFCWSWWWLWMFLTGAGVLDDVLDGLHMLWGNYVWNLIKIWLGLVALMTFWMICICPEEAMFKI